MGDFVVDDKRLQELVADFSELSGIGTDRIMESLLNEAGNRFINKVKKKTKIGPTGDLARNWNMNNSKKRKVAGSHYELVITNPTEYAEYYEYGHRQTPGRYVPAIGKRLKKSWVPGYFPAKQSQDELRHDLPAILGKKMEEMIRRALNV